jgi:acyl-CoA synthetase (AMP-forming)/AMP-acid ligase II
MQTLVSACEATASRSPERGITLRSSRTHCTRRTFPDVLGRAREAAMRWAALGVGGGDLVLIAVDTSWGWLEAWLGALWRGALPLAVPPPRPFGAMRVHDAMLEQLSVRLKPARILIERDEGPYAHGGACSVSATAAISPQQFERTPPAAFAPTPVSSDAAAFLQLTSGTTRFPRAIVISHAAVLNNIEAIAAAAANVSRRPAAHGSVVSWLPLHHDMGLVGALLLSLVTGRELHLMAPKLFLAWPGLWLESIASASNVITLSPTFGYQHCLEQHPPGPSPGMATWHTAICGAEMLRADVLGRFADRFGVRPETLRPGYGLGEATLGVTLDQRGRGVRTRPAPQATARQFALDDIVCVGAPLPGTEIRVVDLGDRPVADDVIGEVQVRGPGVASGYYADAAATAETFRDGWLCTGDLGFLGEGELYLTGRRKDIMIIRGENVAPHAMERIAEVVSDAPASCRAAAFSVSRDARGEQAVLVVETRNNDPRPLCELEQKIRARVARDLGLQLAELMFVRRGSIPRTSSGKLQRASLREIYLAGGLAPALMFPELRRQDA